MGTPEGDAEVPAELDSVGSSPPGSGSPDDPAVDHALFERIQKGSTEAFAAFYDRHARLLYSVAFRILGDAQDAEDVLQESAVLLWEKAPIYNAVFGRPQSWAVTLTRNRAIDRLRARQRKLDLHAAAGLEGATEPLPSDECTAGVTAGERAGTIRVALSQLPAEQRRAIELAFFSGMTQTEIASALGVPLGTIKARIRRGLLSLRDSLEENL